MSSIEHSMDRGWAWVVLTSTFLSSVNIGFLTYNVGILNVALLDKYQKNVSTTAFVGSTFLSLLFLMGPLGSIFINRFNCRVTHIIGGCLACIGFSAGFFVSQLEILIITYSIFGGTGLSLCYTVTGVVLTFSFRKYFGFAVGLSMAGGGFGMFISGPLSLYLLDTYGLRGTYLILGGFALNEVTLGQLMYPTSSEIFHKLERTRTEESKIKNRRFSYDHIFQFTIFRNKAFVLILICSCLWNVPYSIVVCHLPNFVISQGYTPDQAALMVTVFGIGSTLNRLLTGLTVGPKGLDPLLLFLGFNGILGILTFTFHWYSSYYIGQAIFSFIFGIYTGGLNSLRNPICINLVELKNLPSAVGLILSLEGVGYIIGPPTAGLIMDKTGSYAYSFFLSGAIFITAFQLSLMSSIWRKETESPIPFKTEETVYEIELMKK